LRGIERVTEQNTQRKKKNPTACGNYGEEEECESVSTRVKILH